MLVNQEKVTVWFSQAENYKNYRYVVLCLDFQLVDLVFHFACSQWSIFV